MIAPHPKAGLRVAGGKRKGRNIVGSRVGLVRWPSRWPSKGGHKGTSKQRTPDQTWTAPQLSPNRNGFRSVCLPGGRNRSGMYSLSTAPCSTI
jgi:hypothetical protein